jgi:tetratricopeptide (TPR) repeat protein
VQSQHDADAARERYIEALDGARAAGCDRIAAIIAANLGELEFERGNAAMALQFADESLEGHRRSDIPNAAMALCNSAAYLVALGNFNDARARAREALAASRNGEFEACLSFTLLHLATIAALRPPRNACNTRTDYMRAARLVGYAVAHPSNVKEAWEYTEQHAYDQVSSALERALSADEFAKLMEQGSAWSEDRAVAEAALV